MKRILVIEDDKAIRTALTAVLENAEYEVLVAENGSEALIKLKSFETLPQLIVLDLMMPVMNGFEFRDAQLADKSISDIPVILLTANNYFKEYQEKLQAYEFLNKPVEIKDLLYVVDNYFYFNSKSNSKTISSSHS